MPYPAKDLLQNYNDMVEILLMIHVFLTEDPDIECLLCCAHSCSEKQSKINVPN